jgi:3-hydroxyisobutyrate dehydrogenase
VHPLDRLTVLGTGRSGGAIAARLAAEGRDVVVWNRTRARAEALGLPVADSPADAVRGAAAVLLVVLDEEAVDDVLGAALPALEPGALLLDLTTTSPEATHRLDERVGRYVKAPFFGSVPEAGRGALFFTVGCAEEDADDAAAALAPLGEAYRVGDAETCARLKLALNLLVFTMVGAIAETISLARALGVDPQLALDVLARGTGVRAPIYQGRGRMMLDGDFTANASVDMALKDLALIRAAAGDLELPLTDTAHALFRRAAEAGLADEDMAAVIKLLAA